MVRIQAEAGSWSAGRSVALWGARAEAAPGRGTHRQD